MNYGSRMTGSNLGDGRGFSNASNKHAVHFFDMCQRKGCMSAESLREEYSPTTGIMWFIRGQCTQCGKLTPPVIADPGKDDMEALSRLRDMVTTVGWFVDVYRSHGGPRPGIKCIFRCAICDREKTELASTGKPGTITRVGPMSEPHS